MIKNLNAWCRANWDKVPAEKRGECLALLRDWLPEDVQAEFAADRRRGEDVGSHIPCFHFLGGGMQIRNKLREVLKDDELPDVEQIDGSLGRNWDDFYTGALEELAEHYLAAREAEKKTW